MRILLVAMTVLVATLFHAGCAESNPKPGAGVTPPPPPAPKTQFEIDKEAFHVARKAAAVDTWDAATALLDEINLTKLDDKDVIEYVVFSKLCVRTAQALGVDRKSNPTSPTDVIKNIEWVALIATLSVKALEDRAGAGKLLVDANKVYKGIDDYQKRDARLATKYGSK
jgi:hypothetical protein